MLQYKNNILKSDMAIINTADYCFELNSDIDATFFGILKLNNDVLKVIQFSKIDSTYKARLIISQDMIPNLIGSTFKLSIVDKGFNQYSNDINLKFDINKISLNIKVNASNEIEELTRNLAVLSERLETLTNIGVIPKVNIVNKDLIKPGMTLVALDSAGNFAAAYPFVDIITKVNEQRAVNGVVNIDASMIKYNMERTITEEFKLVLEAITKTNNALLTLSNNVKDINARLKDVSIKLDTHLDNGI